MFTIAPPSRRGRRCALALVAALALVPAACSSSDSAGNDDKGGDPPAATSTTVADDTTTTEAVAAFETPEAAAQALYDAWKADDKEAAGEAATPGALLTLWAEPAGDFELAASGCVAEGGATTCPFEGQDGASLTFAMGQQGTGWVVVDVP